MHLLACLLADADARRRAVRVAAHVRHRHRHCRPHSDGGRRAGRALHHGATASQDRVAFGQLHLQRPVHEYGVLAQQLGGLRWQRRQRQRACRVRYAAAVLVVCCAGMLLLHTECVNERGCGGGVTHHHHRHTHTHNNLLHDDGWSRRTFAVRTRTLAPTLDL